jgi:hypothetical protein
MGGGRGDGVRGEPVEPVSESDSGELARPERLELPTCWFEARRSIRLSYGRARLDYSGIRLSLIQSSLIQAVLGTVAISRIISAVWPIWSLKRW